MLNTVFGPWLLLAAVAVGVFLMLVALLIVIVEWAHRRRHKRRRPSRRGGDVLAEHRFGNREAGDLGCFDDEPVGRTSSW